MKKLASLIICLLLVASLPVCAFATETDQSGSSVSDTDALPDDSGSSGENTPETGGSSEDVHTHDWGSGSITTAPTCTAEGVKTYTCSCGATATETIAATGHAYGSWSQTESIHSRTCGTCGAVDNGGHTMSSQITTAPTCKDTGVETHSCSVCGLSFTEQLPVSSTHTYGEWTLTETAHSRSCTVCGAADSGSHSWDGGSVTIKPTCKEEGANAYLCTTCGGVLVEVLPKLTTHTYDHDCDPECNVCGATRETEHKFSTAWTKNYKEHWHACTVCGEKNGTGDHYPGPAATEEKDQICLTCGYIMTPKLGHVHKYSAQWSSDETGHWYACEGCEDQKDFDDHEYDDQCDPDCNVCGFLSPTAHTYEEGWSSDETGHWSRCTVCGEEMEKEAHTPDPNAGETDAVLCTLCGYEIAPAQEHVHEPDPYWVTDEENHWKTCECGEEVDKAPHAWDEGTENEDTTITYRCTECDAERTEGEPKAPRSFPFGIVLALLAVIAVGLVAALVILLRPGKKNRGKFAK